MLALKEFKDHDISEVLKRSIFCPKLGHEKKELELFCEICKAAICNACALIDHDGHAKSLLDEVANERRIALKSLIETEKERLQKMKSKRSHFDENVFQIYGNAAFVERSVQESADKMISVIEAKKKEMIQKVKKQAEESLQRLEVGISENELKITETAIEIAETLLKQSPDAEIIRPNPYIDQKLQQRAKEQVDELNDPAISSSVPFLEYDFAINKKLLDSLSDENIGTFKYFPTKTRPHLSCVNGRGVSEFYRGLDANLVLTTRNRKGEQCYEEGDCVTVDVEDSPYFSRMLDTRIQNNRDGTYEISYMYCIDCWYSKPISVKVNGEHVHGSPFTVKAKSRQLRPISSFGVQGSSDGMFNEPLGVAVNGRDEIAVSDSGNHRVQVFSSDGTYLRSFGIEGDKHGEFHMPSGIAFDANGNIFVAESGNQQIQCFTGEGEYLSHFYGHSNPDICPAEP